MHKANLLIRTYSYIWASCVFGVMYLALNWNRPFVLLPQYIWDDGLQFQQSYSLSHGAWLGTYTVTTLAKGVVFPLWTALLHVAHIPLWLGTNCLYLIGCVSIIYALRRLALNRWLLIGLYALLLFNPMGTTRAYRDYLIPALTLLLCSWAIGTFATLATWRDERFGSSRSDLLLFTAIGTLSLPAWYFIREDGVWLIVALTTPIAIALLSWLWWYRHSLRQRIRTVCLVVLLVALPFVAVGVADVTIAALNQHYYGRRVTNDYFSTDFTSAYAALSRVDSTGPKHLTVPVPYRARQKIYAVSPSFRHLQPCLDGSPATNIWCVGYEESGTHYQKFHDYEGGWFPFALRTAAARAGYYTNATTAKKYYTGLANEVNAACNSGSLACHEAHAYSLVPLPSNATTSAWTGNAKKSITFLLRLTKKDNVAYPTSRNNSDQTAMANYYHVRYKPITDTIQGKLLRAIYVAYAVFSRWLLYSGVVILVMASVINIKWYRCSWKLLGVGWLVLVTILLRVIMLAYIQTVSFPTAANIYYEPLYALVFLFEGLSVVIFGLTFRALLIRGAGALRPFWLLPVLDQDGP